MGSSKKVTVGFRYRMGLHFVLCRTLDSLEEIIVGERIAWSGDLTDNSTFFINKWDLFGGDKREGGIEGLATALFGGATQDEDDYLATKIGGLIPAFRGVVSVVFKGGRVTANNPYIKPWWFRCTRIHTQGDGSEQWYDERAAVPGSVGATATDKPYELNWWQSSFHAGTGDDRAAMGMTFLDADGVEISSDTAPIIGVLPAQSWLARTLTGTVPAGTSTIRVRMLMDRHTGTNNDGYIDDIELTIDGEPIALVNPGAELGTTGWTSTVGTLSVRTGAPTPHSGAGSFGGGATNYCRAYQDIVSPIDIVGMNPAHIVRECLTDPYLRMNYPASMLDDDSFGAAADVFYNEGMGLNFFWSNQTTVKDFLQTVLDHCGAVYYADPFTGKFVLTPIRGGYDVDTLPIFDESSIIDVESFERSGAGEVVNEISVQYGDLTTGRDAVTTVQDLASVYSQGAVIGQTRQYPGIGNAALAARVAQRDLVSSTAALARIKARFTREASTLRPGAVIKFSWAKLGLSELICRVLDVSYGVLDNGEVRAELAEDVFGLPAASYQATQPGGWTPPPDTPEPVATQQALEGTYWDVYRETATADFEALSSESGFVYTLAAALDGSQYSYSIYSRIDPADYELGQEGLSFAPHSTLGADVARDDTTITLSGTGDVADNIAVGDRLLIGAGDTEEQLEVTDLTDILTGVVGVNRGVLDTTPQTFASGADVWLLELDEEDFGRDAIERFDGDTVDYKLLAASGGGDSSLDDATEMSVTFASRMFRPYPPGKIRINGTAFPTSVTGAFTVTWAHRDRVQQTASFISQDDSSIGPEAGTTYNLYFYNDGTNALAHQALDITGATYTVPNVVGTFAGRLEIESKRDGAVSWERQVREFAFTGAVTPSGTYLISGGVVTLTSGTTYHVTAASYVISGTPYSSAAANPTLAAADPLLDRIDVIAVDTAGAVVVLAGTPASTPVKPTVSATQLELAAITISATSSGIPVHSHNAADVVYDNATSGLTADDVQEAIDELAATGGGGDVSTDSIFDAKGDLVVGTGADTAARFPVGTDGYVLIADSSQTKGVRWGAPSGGGAGGGGAMQFVGDATISGAAASTLTISGLDLSSDELYEIELGLKNATASLSTCSVYLNGDTTATNYDRNVDGTQQNNAQAFTMTASTSTSVRGTLRIGTDGNARWMSNSNQGSTSLLQQRSAVRWRTVANVTSITISGSTASSLDVGSFIRVWKLSRSAPGGAGGIAIYKTADEVRTSTTTLADDSTLKATLLPNKKYVLEFLVYLDTGATPDFKYDFNFTGTTTSVMMRRLYSTHALASIATGDPGTVGNPFLASALNVVTTFAVSAGSEVLALQFWITIDVGATGGVFSFRWAQGTSSATATTVRRNSALILHDASGATTQLIYATSDLTKTADAVLAADPILQVPLQANSQYVIEINVLCDTNATADWNADCNYTGTLASVHWVWDHTVVTTANIAGGTASTTTQQTIIGSGINQSHAVANTATQTNRQQIRYAVQTTTAGTFQYRWAQTVASGSSVRRKDSHMRVTKV